MSIISISRGTKSGGLELARRLSIRLGYSLLDKEEVLAESAKKFRGMRKFLEGNLEKMPSLWQRFTHEYERYICFIRCALFQAVKQDNVVFNGYEGPFLLRRVPHVLKLRIHAPLDYRIRSVREEFNYTCQEAIEYIKRVDDERKRWIKMVYNKNCCDPALYDMCVNLRDMSMNAICDAVSAVLEHKAFKKTEDSTKRLNNLALQCAVKATLWSDDTIWHSTHRISIIARDGVIVLKGMAKDEALKALIEETASGVKGVIDCKSEMQLVTEMTMPDKWDREIQRAGGICF